MSLHAVHLLVELRQLLFDPIEPLLGASVRLLGERRPFDLELLGPAVEHIYLGRHRVNLDPETRGRFVDEIDRFVGKETPGDVTV